jgi:hypothetical protein
MDGTRADLPWVKLVVFGDPNDNKLMSFRLIRESHKGDTVKKKN